LNYTFYDQYHLPPEELNPNATILDLGSHVGYTLVHLKYIYPNARLIGVEMDIDNFRIAQKNIEGIENCYILNKAVSIKDGIAKYDKNRSGDSYHLFNNAQGNEKSSLIEIETITINTIINKFNLDNIDYVKMDIEGEEDKIFNSSSNNDLGWLNIVRMMNIEIHKNLFIESMIQVIEKYGFRVWKDDKHWSTIMAIRK
jgi:FkbM family methyltransferase